MARYKEFWYNSWRSMMARCYNEKSANYKYYGCIGINVCAEWHNANNFGEWAKTSGWFEWQRDGKEIPKIHPTQKPVNVLRRLIEIFTDEGDVVIDPCAGSASTLRAAHECNRNAYGFEVSRKFYNEAKEKMLNFVGEQTQMII